MTPNRKTLTELIRQSNDAPGPLPLGGQRTAGLPGIGHRPYRDGRSMHARWRQEGAWRL